MAKQSEVAAGPGAGSGPEVGAGGRAGAGNGHGNGSNKQSKALVVYHGIVRQMRSIAAQTVMGRCRMTPLGWDGVVRDCFQRFEAKI